MKNFNINGLGKIPKEGVINDYEVEGYPSKIKSAITKNINLIIKIEKPKAIKVGKTVNFTDRRTKQDYWAFNKMFILYSSDSANFVKELEGYYIKYTKEHFYKLSKNERFGSAGRISNNLYRCHVYMVTD
jgi:hypothetical protein